MARSVRVDAMAAVDEQVRLEYDARSPSSVT